MATSSLKNNPNDLTVSRGGASTAKAHSLPSLKRLTDYFYFLDALRESGVTNMYGASPHLETSFGLKRDVAVKVLSAWMGTFSKDAPKTRALNAIAQAAGDRTDEAKTAAGA